MVQLARHPAVIFDRDGTLASIRHHQDSAGDIIDWGSYNGLVAYDAPVPIVAGLLRSIRPGITRIMTSGRMDTTQRDMRTWLRKYDLPIDVLFMRRDKDQRRDSIVKQEIYDTLIKPHYDVLLVVDDRPSVCDMWRANGLHVIQVVDPGIDPPILRKRDRV